MMTRHAAWHMWRLSEAGDDNLGLACSDDGLFIGRTPLIEKRDGLFVARQQQDIERLLTCAYRTEVRADRLMSGLATVARALKTNDQCLARIAAVHLRIPDIPDRAARNAMEAMDVLIKYARDAGGDDGNWNPAQHPRTGTPPNPGWFAPTGGSSESFSGRTAQNDDPTRRSDASPSSNDDWVRLRPGPKRIDELADLIEWIANAKPEDAPAITAEIDRYFKNVGWEAAAKDLNNMLAVLTRPGITKEDRLQYLNRLDLYTRVDPEEYLQIFGFASSFALAGGGIPPIAREEREAAEATANETGAAIEARAAEASDTPSEVWKYGWAKRGREIHDRFGDGSLHQNFPVIDMFSAGVVTSLKSIDLSATVYQNDRILAYRINRYFDKVSEFDGAEFAEDVVSLDKITGRVLQLVIPRSSITEEQRIVIEAARTRAAKLKRPVDLVITEF
jgi:hypothetical protein